MTLLIVSEQENILIWDLAHIRDFNFFYLKKKSIKFNNIYLKWVVSVIDERLVVLAFKPWALWEHIELKKNGLWAWFY